ncbi:hypothetical protein SCLCIDRAFT_131122, partial [Scleroderma citrinum Foug A]
QIAKSGHQAMCRYIVTQEAFPLPVYKDDMCWDRIVQALKEERLLTTKLESIEGDMEMKGLFLDYVWGVATQVRGEVVYKARMTVPPAYGLPGDLKGEQLNDVIKWLVKEGKMLHPGIDIKMHTCDDTKPWQHPIFGQIIKAQWWGPKGGAKRLGDDPSTNPYINTPLPMLALTAATVHNISMLSHWLIFFPG